MVSKSNQNNVFFSNKNRRMAYRVQLEHGTFSLFYNNIFYPCLSISNQGCLIEGCLDFSSNVINTEIWYESLKIEEVKVKIIRSSSEGTVALHFVSIGRKAKTVIEEYIISLQKEDLRRASTKKRNSEEERILREYK